MGQVLGVWNGMGKNAMIILLALCAITYLHHPDFAEGAAHVHAAVSRIANVQEQEQMEVPIAAASLLPMGIKGIFCAVVLMGSLGDGAMHMHSWGSLLVQDFLVPLRKKPFAPERHLLILRCSIFGVGCFAFLFGILFHLTDYINMWWSATTAIFTGGAGAAIIGGLYWKKGTTAGAWAAFLTGSTLSLTGIIFQQVYAHHGTKFGLNGAQIAFFSCLTSIVVYIATSLFTFKEDFDLDRMLHRDKHPPVKAVNNDAQIKPPGQLGWGKWIGFDENFTRADKLVAGSLFGWSLFWVGVFVIGTLWNLISPWPTSTWASYCHVVGFGLPIFFAAVIGIWFTWGGVRDLRDLFRRLHRERVNNLDDGTVINHRNLDEAGPTGENTGS
jgi:SSS family solute:Na+ symporter